ncbi:methylated-DNA--[protein]-cysteine S-methyltransferase [Mycolicibacterium diernhoferi]|uniref:methylated-DNA--[protein]-cysteine S-methyltransferase n=1 Tax=Mycolicibacterium diernhoferi TaxID=1801 RepID=A0A1Q4H4I9_9MYCO|nr:methylated-DNA--[protein]-cysteine S-methyltransferase [Mycolicibacterium diernhoferi]OJZ62479.1 cysteine methyltransferase [Mycolicibacterium diernhoferi]OPE50031.1 cysteine methyltransferase [Mycolicibacterium diernhoferi]PEG52210.1 methylated-DNA--[protein]-cysteine S-methyltransferase [Mycolicibacterium diernhoferi]QYL22011.1 methylated-DNA--[protein]-cysteine S-methyltransferase [Mycolicibacterium diernhoferi]
MTENFNAAIFDAVPADEATLARLHRRLEHDAGDAGLLDVAYRTLDTAIGRLLLARTPVGLVRVAFLGQAGESPELASLAQRISPRVLHAPARLDDAAAEIDEYLRGVRTRFDLALDLQLTDGFRRKVVEQLQRIEYGHRESYAALAASVGSPRAVRAVGSACARNPLPVVIPCHRVVRTDGSIGQYAGGAAAKAVLLAMEAA